jgi:2-oxoisovalerate dehydrogenase E1 component
LNALPDPLARIPTDEAMAQAVLIRTVEQRLLDMFAAGKLFGTVHTCIGQEWSGIAIAQALGPGDTLFSNHRCHGHYLARTGDVDGLIAEVMGKQCGVCGGRGGSQHLCNRDYGFFSNGVQGGMMPVAAGYAMAHRLRQTGNIAVVFIGDGTLGEGTVYETLNVAAKWELPLLIVLENNGYAQSTDQRQTLAGEISARAAAFGIATRQGSSWQPNQLIDAAAECVDMVRREGRPVFLQVDCDRLMAHSKGDDDRDPQLIAAKWAKDSLQLLLNEQPAKAQTWLRTAAQRVDEAVARAETVPYSRYAEADQELIPAAPYAWRSAGMAASERVVAATRAALARNMHLDPRILLLGEDIESPYGGAFKVTKGLSQEFPGRVRNTPISEATIAGLGNGLALAGFLPVCEIMFGDFLTLAADQFINHAAKFRYMYNRQVRIPLILRTPMGGGRGYGPTHSQSLEKHFLGVPQTCVLALHNRWNPGMVYDRLFASIDRPTLVIEHKVLYAAQLDAPIAEGFALEHSTEPYPTTRLRPLAPPQVTVFCYGGMLPAVEQAVAEAFDEWEIAAEVLCPIQIYPLNVQPVIDSLATTHQLLIVEEGMSFAAVGSELIAQVVEKAPGILRHVKRVGPPLTPIASCGPLEKEVLPNVRMLVDALRELNRHA